MTFSKKEKRFLEYDFKTMDDAYKNVLISRIKKKVMLMRKDLKLFEKHKHKIFKTKKEEEDYFNWDI